MDKPRFSQTDYSPMQRVTRNRPCPVCGKPDWCLVAEDDGAAICQRIEDGSVKRCGDAGWLHVLEERHGRGGRRRYTSTVSQERNPTTDFTRLSACYQTQLTDERLQALAGWLGLSRTSLQRLQIGWDSLAFTFPMVDATGRIVGIRRRFLEGRKSSVRGSKNGLFVPTGLIGSGLLLIAEGPTDAAAGLDLGFNTIGRPNCNSLVAMTAQATTRHRELVVLGDNDEAGTRGAASLSDTLVLHHPTRVVHPPPGNQGSPGVAPERAYGGGTRANHQ